MTLADIPASLVEHLDTGPYIIGVLLLLLSFLGRMFIKRVWVDILDKISGVGTKSDENYALLAEKIAGSLKEHQDFRSVLFNHEGRIASLETAVFERHILRRRDDIIKTDADNDGGD